MKYTGHDNNYDAELGLGELDPQPFNHWTIQAAFIAF